MSDDEAESLTVSWRRTAPEAAPCAEAAPNADSPHAVEEADTAPASPAAAGPAAKKRRTARAPSWLEEVAGAAALEEPFWASAAEESAAALDDAPRGNAMPAPAAAPPAAAPPETAPHETSELPPERPPPEQPPAERPPADRPDRPPADRRAARPAARPFPEWPCTGPLSAARGAPPSANPGGPPSARRPSPTAGEKRAGSLGGAGGLGHVPAFWTSRKPKVQTSVRTPRQKERTPRSYDLPPPAPETPWRTAAQPSALSFKPSFLSQPSFQHTFLSLRSEADSDRRSASAWRPGTLSRASDLRGGAVATRSLFQGDVEEDEAHQAGTHVPKPLSKRKSVKPSAKGNAFAEDLAAVRRDTLSAAARLRSGEFPWASGVLSALDPRAKSRIAFDTTLLDDGDGGSGLVVALAFVHGVSKLGATGDAWNGLEAAACVGSVVFLLQQSSTRRALGCAVGTQLRIYDAWCLPASALGLVGVEYVLLDTVVCEIYPTQLPPLPPPPSHPHHQPRADQRPLSLALE
ncbi:hypothetical protein M885DRAFT_620536 [Pelagophyceae sp. CCMP2097]|nr:hypothetical protein M885DRAFT_620536 [Pelagophyceae sp. CCMP2097]